MTIDGRAGRRRPTEDPRRIARLRKTQRIRVNSATSTPVLAGLVAWSMHVAHVPARHIVGWVLPLLLASLLSAVAAFQRRGDRYGTHPFDTAIRVPMLGAMVALPFLIGMPSNTPDHPEAAILALVASTSLLALIGLQFRRHRDLYVMMIGGLGSWFVVLLGLSDRLVHAGLAAAWSLNVCAVLVHALNTRNDLAEISDENLRMSRLDGLTGALNRVGLLARWSEAREHNAHHTLILIDLDRFKDVNDRWGHAAGDELLIEVTRRLFDTVGEAGSVARLGGDEFAAVMAGEVRDPAVQSAVAALGAALDQPFVTGAKTVPVGASIGIVALEPGDDIAVALTNADFAMFEAKRSSTDNVALFDPAMRASLDRRRSLEEALPLALERGEFEWWGQPILSTTTLEPVGVELLCRWKHDGRYQPPAEFLELLADADLLVELGQRNLEFAATWLARWREDRDLAHVGLNVNLAPHHLLTCAVEDIALAVPLRDRTRLLIEMVETEVIPQGAELRRQSERLQRMGCRLVLDDFGAGYSALSVLSELNVSTIKIDRSLVSGVDHDDRKSKLVAAASQIGSTLGTSTVCEGVETAEELAAIRQIGVPLVQGWLFSEALPMDQCEALLRRFARISRGDADQTTMDRFERLVAV